MFDVKNIKTLKSIGGKTRLLKVLLPIIRYAIRNSEIIGLLDLFGGGNKFIPQFKIVPFRLYNDLDRGVSNIMACLSNWISARELVDKVWELKNTIKTKEDFQEACDRKEDLGTPLIESAALTILIAEYSRAGDRKTFWKKNVEKGVSYESLARYKELVPLMQDVVITEANYSFYVENYGHRSDFLAILDPPYVDSDIYGISFSKAKHEELVRLIENVQMKIILCGTNNSIYSYLTEDKGWYKYFVGDIPKSSSAKKGEKQEEFIWTNMKLPSYLLPKQTK